MLFSYKRPPAHRLATLLADLERPYRRRCADDASRLSFGMLAAAPARALALSSATLPACVGESLVARATDIASYTHLMVHLRLRVGPGISAPENTHPFVWRRRYAFMHNGVVPGVRLPKETARHIQGQTDSERFLALWMSHLKGADGLLAALRAALADVDDTARINLVLLDKLTGEFVVYRHTTGSRAFPCVWVDADAGIVANYKATDNSVVLKKGHVLHREAWGGATTVARQTVVK